MRFDSFSILHVTAYTYIALQECVLFYYYPRAYWYTSCLTVNSDSIDMGEEEKKKNKTINFAKIAKAINGVTKEGIKVIPPYVNLANYEFAPDAKNNQIVYSLKGVSGVGEDLTNNIITQRKEGKYTSVEDFYNRVNPKKGEMYALIKCGAFDEFNSNRKQVMKDFIIKHIMVPKEKLTSSNIPFLMANKLIPEEFKQEIRFINYKKYVLSPKFKYEEDQTSKAKNKPYWYILDDISEQFFNEFILVHTKEDVDYKYNEEGNILVHEKKLDKLINNLKQPVIDWLGTQEALELFNKTQFLQEWKAYCLGDTNTWEMQTLSYYLTTPHELDSIDCEKYMVSHYKDLPREPKIVGQRKRKDKVFYDYELSRICGTVIGKNDTKHIVTILTDDNDIVDIKFWAGAYTNYNKKFVDEQTQQKEDGWFTRGSKICVVGFRQDDMFRNKKGGLWEHSVAKIVKVENGLMYCKNERGV